jgi:hypothetical protein
MILGDPIMAGAPLRQGQGGVTLDEVFRHLVQRRPDALAIVDPPNRPTFTDGAPRRLTYAQADCVVAAIAERLRRMGLSTDAIVGMQLPNIAESVLTMLGVVRAGMIAAPLPLLWRRADAVAALARVGAKALISCAHVGDFNHCQFAMRVAAEVFSIRYVCGFGNNLPDGVVPFGDLFGAAKLNPIPALERERQMNAAAHIAAITFEVGAQGLVPVARNHSELLAGGLGVLLESRVPQESILLSTLAPSSFAGISMTLLPWLLSGGTLVLHHPFDADALEGQLRDERPATLVVPGQVAFRLAEGGIFRRNAPSSVIAAWCSPERLAMSPVWRDADTAFTDVAIFGEAGLVPARRGIGGRPSPVSFGVVGVPRGKTGGVIIAELLRTEAGTVAMRGAMVPKHSFPPGAERSGQPHFKVAGDGIVDTGYTCRVDSISKAMVVTGPPSGLVSVGGYRFPLQDLQDVVGRIDNAATLAGLPDPLIGQRLIGNAAHRQMMQAALDAVGLNPIVVSAFRDRSARRDAPTAA